MLLFVSCLLALLSLTACGDQKTSSLPASVPIPTPSPSPSITPTSNPSPSSSPTSTPQPTSTPVSSPSPTSTPQPTPTPSVSPSPTPAPLPAGEVFSTVGGSGSVSTNSPGGAFETANDIDAVLENIPGIITIAVSPGAGPVIPLSGLIRLPNGSVATGEVFYKALVSPGNTSFEELVENVCDRFSIPPGETCEFEDVIPAFPGTFSIEFTFIDGAEISYSSTRTVTVISPESTPEPIPEPTPGPTPEPTPEPLPSGEVLSTLGGEVL